MKRFSLLLFTIVTLVACSQSQPPTASTPSTLTPTLTLTPASVNINAGNPAVSFNANVQNSSEPVTWTYSGPGSVTPAGTGASYTPPTKVKTTESGTLTATLGSTGITATAPIVIYPANVTPPAEPPPTTPNPPSNPPANPPSNPPSNPNPPTTPPTDPNPPITPPTDPNPPTTPPTDPNPPSTPPTDPNPPAEPPATPPDPTVTIANVEPVTLALGFNAYDSTASVDLDASTKNAPANATYQWTVEGTNTDKVYFTTPTAEDTKATFSMDGTYTLRLTVTADSKSVTATVDVTVNPVPPPASGQNVVGYWKLSVSDFRFELKQSGEDVRGLLEQGPPPWHDQVEGEFDGIELKLKSNRKEIIVAVVSGDTMTGTYTHSIGGNQVESIPITGIRN